jgi:hypothetical protein
MARSHPARHKGQSPEATLARLYAAASPNNEEEASALLDGLAAMCGELARREAKSPADVLTKISVWRVMASEDARSYDTATPDEVLALSIMDDCERLWGQR